jgi:hypothetical protein
MGREKFTSLLYKTATLFATVNSKTFFHVCRNLGYAIGMSSESGFFYMLPFSYLKSIIYGGPF